MEFTKRTVTSRPGLTQEEALESLQTHPEYTRRGMRLASIRRRGDQWVATVLEPKTAGENPFEESGDSEPSGESEAPKDESSDSEGSSSSDSSESKSDGPPSGDKKEKGGGDAEVLTLLKAIADALGVHVGPEADGMVPGGDDLGALDAPAPGIGGGPDAPPAPKGDAPHLPTKLKPGEVLPHQTPVGAPAFSSTKQANGVCPGCMGQLGPDGTCPTCAPAAVPGAPAAAPTGQPGAAAMQPLAGRVASFTASTEASKFSSIKAAKESLERVYGPQGYKVKQIKREGDKVRALLSVR